MIENSEILVVDDKPENIQLLTELLSKNGYKAKGAPGGTWALKAISNYTPDLIILDILMPDLNGFEVCKELKSNEKTADIPIIFLSALDSVSDKVNAFEAGGVDYITKPFESLEVLARVRTHLLISSLQKTLSEKNHALEAEIIKNEHFQKQLIQQSKMAAMGEMISLIAHQWKSPLNSVSIFAQSITEIVEYESCNPYKLKDIQDEIMKQVHYMSDTIDDFRNFFKPSGEISEFKACELAKEAYEFIKAKMIKLNIKLIVPEHEHFTVRGYPNEFRQVILNIYNNTCDEFKKHESDKGERKIELAFSTKDGKGIITISDNAGGIPEDLLPDTIFDSYTTTKGDQGTGIGMYIAKTIVEDKLNGRIYASNVNGGARFTIELPLSNS